MLMKLGAIEFELFPLNTHEYSRSSMTDFARKPVVGARQPLEYVGQGEETMSITGRLFPHKLGGLAEFAVLRTMQEAGMAQFLMRGDGRPLGWFVVESVEENSSEIHYDGVGQVIDFTIKLCRSPKPSAISFSFNLFQGGLN